MPMLFPTSPAIGQVFTSGGRSWVWTGSTWDSPAGSPFVAPGLTLIRSDSFTGVASQSFNNVFSSQYRNYFVIIDSERSGVSNITFRMRAAGTDDSGSNYIQQNLRSIGSSFLASGSTTTFGYINTSSSATQFYGSVNIFKPFLVSKTNFLTTESTAQTTVGLMSTEHQLVSSYDGFTIIASTGTLTGVIRIYGYKD